MDADDALRREGHDRARHPRGRAHGAARRVAQLPRLGRRGAGHPAAGGGLRARPARPHAARPAPPRPLADRHDLPRRAARASCSAPTTSSSTSPPTRSSRDRSSATVRGRRGGGGESADRPHSLEIYMDSLRATRAMDDVDLVLAGHGEPVTDHVALIDERFRMHARRAEKIRRPDRQGPADGLRDRRVAVGQRRGHAGLPDAVRGARARRPARHRGAGGRAARRRRGALRRRRDRRLLARQALLVVVDDLLGALLARDRRAELLVVLRSGSRFSLHFRPLIVLPAHDALRPLGRRHL